MHGRRSRVSESFCFYEVLYGIITRSECLEYQLKQTFETLF